MRATLGDVTSRLAGEGLLRAGADFPEPLLETPVVELSSDSREIRDGWLFCAIRGTTADGHRFIGAAAEQGAVAAVVAEPDPAVDLPQIPVEDDRLAASYAAAQLFGDPWDRLILVGVTGTNGKTTSVAILRHLLSRRHAATSIGTLGVVGTEGHVVPGTEGLTTPGPVELARWLDRLSRDGVDAVAMEVSSHALDQRRVAAARFDAALFTNLTRDHLDYHGTVEQYRAAKLRLATLVKPDGVVALNLDDPAWREVSSEARILGFGTGPDAQVRAERLELTEQGMEWTLTTPTGSARVRLPLYGTFNVANALGAAAVLSGLGWGVAEIADGLSTLPQIPGRLEHVPTPSGTATVLIDYAHTPDALERALLALRPLVSGRLLVVFGAGGDRDRGKRPEMGKVAAESADLAIVTSDNPRTEDPDSIIDDIERGMGSARRRRVPDRREAIHCALDEAGAGDLVLLAGKGHETYQIRGTEKFPFDERRIVEEHFSGAGS